MEKLGVIGAGAFGTALALAVAERWKEVFLYSDLSSVAQAINQLHLNLQFLPGIGVPIHFTGYDTLDTIHTCNVLFLCVPAQGVRSVCEALKTQHLVETTPVVVCSKGIEVSSGLLIGEVVSSILPNPVYILSGPSFAQELSRCLPTTVTLAGKQESSLVSLKIILETSTLRIEPSLDPIGTQIGGALKNVLAVGAGFVLGAGLGEDARAVLVTKGFQEMQKIAEGLGGASTTLLGMSGLGDMLLTCMSSTSRNTAFGMRVARGEIVLPLSEPFQGPLAEGALTAAVFSKFKARIPHIATPIFSVICEALYTKRPFVETIKTLLYT
ncbi:MAG: NAD(P)H-dependent glycerol-3-phosphate dehydrogenase [Holosporales bacterium]|jgi:glycerol-3-phosphate dehydrogenase (NAD(P)+)|nr:NAD(P)H-dependent glycerol-3-phosphate dehydrogenase [Holosporales bacterium]